MNNFIFSVKEIFTKCLIESQTVGYFIGSYQRGYKWKSKTIHDQVPVLLADLYDAFLKSLETNKNSEYYLQYITVKKTEVKGEFFFEVIDGQQRLTTLTLLFCVINWYFGIENIAKSNNGYLLKYIRFEERNQNIFDYIHQLISDEVDKLDLEKLDEQDIYYLCNSALTIKSFFSILQENENKNFEKFYEFVLNNVKIIINREDEFSASEEVFSSLNANKVPLTNEYLIKGLLLTRASRIDSTEGAKKNFKEILDERSLMSKTWDEMHSWFTQQDVGSYFFGNKNSGMERFLSLIKHEKTDSINLVLHNFRNQLATKSNKDDQYELFNKFHENIKSGEGSKEYLEKIKHLYFQLRNWYEDTAKYNLIGYYLLTGGKLKHLLEKDKSEVDKMLKEHLIKRINSLSEKIDEIEYPNKKINDAFLLINIFPEGYENLEDAHKPRFNFFSYSNEGWSLEHIFPQNPGKGFLDPESYENDKDWLIRKCEENGKDNVLYKIKNNEKLSIDDLSFIYNSFSDVDGIGNLALLSSKVNSALSNGLFNSKRKILVSKINNGNFVPKHTIDVFSKMLEIPTKESGEITEFNSDLVIWTNKDAEAHKTWLDNRLKNLKIEFNV